MRPGFRAQSVIVAATPLWRGRRGCKRACENAWQASAVTAADALRGDGLCW